MKSKWIHISFYLFIGLLIILPIACINESDENSSQVINDTIAPENPTNLAWTSDSSKNIYLSWSASSDQGGSGLAGYIVYRDDALVGTTTSTHYNDSGLSPNTWYTYSVSAYDNADNESTTPPYVNAVTAPEINGLISNYSFDESYGNLPIDGASINRPGMITGASRVEGKIGKGLLFGFDDANVSVEELLYFDEGFITVEAWIKPDEIEAGKTYRLIGGYDYYDFYFQIRDGRLEVLCDGKSYHYGTTPIIPNIWTHVAFTSDGINVITYINGIEDGRTNISLPVQSMANLQFGANCIFTGGTPYIGYIEEFKGTIDEIRIWDTTRSEADIAAHLNVQMFVPQPASADNSYLVAYYDFNESNGIKAIDQSGNGNTGIITTAGRVEGKSGNGLRFGADDSYVSIEDIMYFDRGMIAIETWIRPNEIETGKTYRLIGGYNYAGTYFQIRDGRLEVMFDGQSYHYGTTEIVPNTWTHVAFISDGVNIITYINGVEDGKTNITLPTESIYNIRIGAHQIYVRGIYYVEEFQGIMDELYIWNGIRTQDEIFMSYSSHK